MTVNQKLCKKVVFNTSRSIYFEYLLESPMAILTNIQNIFLRENKNKKMSFLHIILLIKNSF